MGERSGHKEWVPGCEGKYWLDETENSFVLNLDSDSYFGVFASM